MQIFVATGKKETLDACVVRANKFFTLLSQVSSYFSTWHKQGQKRKDLNRSPLDVSDDQVLGDLFNQGRNRKDVGDEVINDLGYRISVWNGRDAESAASLMIKSGLYSTVSGLSNACVLEVPVKFNIDSADEITRLMDCFISVWNPDWAVFTSHEARTDAGEGLFLDKAVYISSKMSCPLDLPDNLIKVQLAQGTLFIAQSAL